MIKVDLHCHSDWSDGESTVEELILESKIKGLEHLSITDHDTMEGCFNALSFAKKQGVSFIPGIELSCKDEESGKKVHLLGYGFTLDNQPLKDYCTKMREIRIANGIEYIGKIRGLGYKLDLKDLEPRIKLNKPIYKAHIMNVLRKNGYTDSLYGLLFKELKKKGVFKRKVPYISYQEGLALLKQAGSIVVLAHIDIYKNYEILNTLLELGLDGIEVFHRYHNEEVWNKLLKIATKNSLLVTGGSDCHGSSVELGVSYPEKYVREFVQRFKE